VNLRLSVCRIGIEKIREATNIFNLDRLTPPFYFKFTKRMGIKQAGDKEGILSSTNG
jgi:hypothetical protein